MLTILKVVVAQIDVLETMTPLEFLSFRERLESGSGFQSDQFRELEFLLGAKNAAALERYPAGQRCTRTRLEARFAAPTLWDAFLRFLAQSGRAVPRDALERDVRERVAPSEPLQTALVELYRARPAAELAVRAPRGSRRGLSGVALPPRQDGAAHDRRDNAAPAAPRAPRYLMTTLNRPLFPDLWAIRTRL